MEFKRDQNPKESIKIGSYQNMFNVGTLRLDWIETGWDMDEIHQDEYGNIITAHKKRKDPFFPNESESHKLFKSLSMGIDLYAEKFIIVMEKEMDDIDDLASWIDAYYIEDIIGKRIKFKDKTYLIPNIIMPHIK